MLQRLLMLTAENMGHSSGAWKLLFPVSEGYTSTLCCSAFHIDWLKMIRTQAAGCRDSHGVISTWLITGSVCLFCLRSDKSSSWILLQCLGRKHSSSVSNLWVSTPSTTPNFPLPQLWNHLVMDSMLQTNSISPRLLMTHLLVSASNTHEWCSATPSRQRLLSNTIWATAPSLSQGPSSAQLSFPWSQGITKHEPGQQQKLWWHPSVRQETGKVQESKEQNWEEARKQQESKWGEE